MHESPVAFQKTQARRGVEEANSELSCSWQIHHRGEAVLPCQCKFNAESLLTDFMHANLLHMNNFSLHRAAGGAGSLARAATPYPIPPFLPSYGTHTPRFVCYSLCCRYRHHASYDYHLPSLIASPPLNSQYNYQNLTLKNNGFWLIYHKTKYAIQTTIHSFICSFVLSFS